MKAISCVTKDGKKLQFYKHSDVAKTIGYAGAFLIIKSDQLKSLNDVIEYKKTLLEKKAKIDEYDKPENIHLLCTDIYYLFQLQKYNSQLKECDVVIKLYSCLYGIDFEGENLKEEAKDIMQKPLKKKFFDPNIFIANKYATYLFNQNNPEMNLSEAEYLEIHDKMFEKENKNRRSK